MTKTVELSVVRLNKFEGEGTARAFCDVAVAQSFLIKGVKVIEGKKGLFVSMPREQGKDGQWYDTVIPLSKEARQEISEVVLEAYRSGAQAPAQAPAGE
ncbi:MAG: septation protein SpoVG family protein [Candidatus Omnitrophica bacterium]|nr:septation protein SpoVG family protein [Candidatus Omnitrophota bacterium]